MLGGTPEAIGDAYLRYSIGKRLCEVRTARGQTVQDLAQASSVPADSIRGYENGQLGLPADVMVRLLRGLGVLAPTFLEGILAQEPRPACVSRMRVGPSRTAPDLQVARGA
ncbi:Transcriptional regulator [Candidatus Rhodobacter oscarellae]|uniref:Transcriptional regulator n=1 Tax=Candidatus Rhodobacter oscarellae TaxID=1675527 RepID=A0A0J9EC88_9RHOB|nr:Transcriptional regulator [Candidatus Rhodobacter lobularis]